MGIRADLRFRKSRVALHLRRELGELSCSSLCYLRYLLFKFRGFHATKYVKTKNRTEGNKGNEGRSEVHAAPIVDETREAVNRSSWHYIVISGSALNQSWT